MLNYKTQLFGKFCKTSKYMLIGILGIGSFLFQPQPQYQTYLIDNSHSLIGSSYASAQELMGTSLFARTNSPETGEALQKSDIERAIQLRARRYDINGIKAEDIKNVIKKDNGDIYVEMTKSNILKASQNISNKKDINQENYEAIIHKIYIGAGLEQTTTAILPSGITENNGEPSPLEVTPTQEESNISDPREQPLSDNKSEWTTQQKREYLKKQLQLLHGEGIYTELPVEMLDTFLDRDIEAIFQDENGIQTLSNDYKNILKIEDTDEQTIAQTLRETFGSFFDSMTEEEKNTAEAAGGLLASAGLGGYAFRKKFFTTEDIETTGEYFIEENKGTSTSNIGQIHEKNTTLKPIKNFMNEQANATQETVSQYNQAIANEQAKIAYKEKAIAEMEAQGKSTEFAREALSQMQQTTNELIKERDQAKASISAWKKQSQNISNTIKENKNLMKNIKNGKTKLINGDNPTPGDEIPDNFT